MVVKVDTYVEHVGGKRDLMNRAFLTLVALDENDKPVPVNRLELETEEEREEWKKAERRRELRKVELERDLR